MSPARTKCVSRVRAVVVGGLLLHAFMVDQVVTDLNIALRQPAFMNTFWNRAKFFATNGNDGDKTTIFHTNRAVPTWWGIDFGLENQLVTMVNVTNRRDNVWYTRVKGFIIGLTNDDPNKGKGPLGNDFRLCASRTERMDNGETISLSCTDQQNTRGRYLFIVANTTDTIFHLAEVEVFTGRLLNMEFL
ncbi:hypothetical protein NP493_1481g00022 [Ridgeia piscesae]|uniref:Fucolectin tachylectin-4 pentraxin-1 domain-containing protein n=1 Tax=Ridgeia piscesae TaxID=27915 RepID=A0AAD9NC34_RIDPI|nr:hypothetical protein NP493_1481g00022 [Ridgeia piscesae]